MTPHVTTKQSGVRELNLLNLKLMSRLLKDVDHFIFFGTLLGFEREGTIIEGDDDIDIMVDIKHRDRVAEILKNSRFRGNIDKQMRRWPSFLSVRRPLEGRRTIADIYFYENDPNKEYILEKWNFMANFRDPASHIHIPKSLIYPFRRETMGDFQVQVPAKPAACCAYLYGDTWNVPRKKGEEYQMIIEDNAPRLIAA